VAHKHCPAVQQGTRQNNANMAIMPFLLIPILLITGAQKITIILILECGPMPNVMAALLNIGGAL